MSWEKWIPALKQSRLFRGMDDRGVEKLLDCIDAKIARKEKDSFFILQGDVSHDVYIVVEGLAVGERVHLDGNIVTLGEFSSGSVFGDVLSGSSVASVVGIRAKADCTAVHFAFDDILSCCADSRTEQTMLLRNLINAIADKYFALNERVMLLTEPTLRARIALFLLRQTESAKSKSFCIPYNREELARYLGCERSALSREISRMARDQFFIVNRSEFTIEHPDALKELIG